MKFPSLFVSILHRRHLPSIGGIFAAALSAIFYTLALPPFAHFFMGWLAIVPLAFYISFFKTGWQTSFLLGILFGLGHYLSSLFWLTALTWAGWFMLCAYLSIYPAVWCVYWSLVSHKEPSTFAGNLFRSAAGGCFWIVLEWIRGFLLTGFGWNFLGVTQNSVLPLIQIADVGGVYAISLLIAFVNLLFALGAERIARAIQNKHVISSHPDLYFAIFTACLVYVYGAYRIANTPQGKISLSITCIQPSIPQPSWGNAPEMSSFAKLSGLSEESLAFSRPQLLIWPESITGGSVLDDGLFHQAVARMMLNHPGLNVLTGSLDYQGLNVYNGAFLFQKNISHFQTYHKQHLVPFGEFVPFSKWIPWFGKMIGVGTDFTPGAEAGIFTLQETGVTLSPLICFEDTVPSLSRKAALQNADILVNLTNDGWFRESAGNQQHFQNALLRAVEFRRPLIRCANNGITALVTPLGNSFIFTDSQESSIYRPGFFSQEVIIPERVSTLYAQWGDWLPKSALALALIGLLFLREKLGS